MTQFVVSTVKPTALDVTLTVAESKSSQMVLVELPRIILTVSVQMNPCLSVVLMEEIISTDVLLSVLESLLPGKALAL